MFARCPRSAFVCLRCQNRLARREQAWQDLRQPTTIPSPRWQSAAAARLEEEPEYDDPVIGASPQSTQKSSNNEREHRDRVWRPSPVAQLGLSSLGKPAEVLVLPSRDRKLPIIPSDDRDSQHSLQETLDSESQPTSPQQVKENLEQIRQQVGLQQGQLEERAWRQLRHRISNGFTAKQLSNYIEQEHDKQRKKFHLFKSKRNWKQQMALHIAKHMWGFSGPEAVEEPRLVTSRTLFPIPGLRLEVLLLRKGRPLQLLSEKHNVQVDVFRDQRRISLSGSHANITAASVDLAELKKMVKKSVMPCDDAVASLLSFAPDNLQKFFEAMGRKYAVAIERMPKDTGLQIYHHRDDVDVVPRLRQEMLIATRRTFTITKAKIWPHQHLSSDALAPVYPDVEPPWSKPETQWGRLIRPSPPKNSLQTISRLSDEGRDALGALYNSLRDDLRDSEVFLPAQRPQGLHEEFTACFGRVLFDRQSAENNIVRPETDDFIATKSTFVSQIPFLPHLLASLPPWRTQDPLPESPKLQSQTDLPLRFRLLLTPVQESVSLPELEILLKGESAKKGLNQPLQIHEISAILDQRSHYLLLPGNGVDVKFVRQVRFDLYNAAAPPDANNTPLLKQLAEYLTEAGNKAEPTFAPFVKLVVPLHLVGTSWVFGEQVQTMKGGSKGRITSKQSSKEKEEQPNSAEYVLAHAGVVDGVAFRPPFHSKLFLNHAVEDGVQWGDSSEKLTLATRPIFEDVFGEKMKFVGFFNTAYEVALHLGRFHRIMH